MDRRQFIKSVAAAGAVACLDYATPVALAAANSDEISDSTWVDYAESQDAIDAESWDHFTVSWSADCRYIEVDMGKPCKPLSFSWSICTEDREPCQMIELALDERGELVVYVHRQSYIEEYHYGETSARPTILPDLRTPGTVTSYKWWALDLSQTDWTYNSLPTRSVDSITDWHRY